MNEDQVRAPNPQLTPAQRERFEERSAIMEYDGCMTREEAERKALAEVTKKQTAS